MIVRQVFPGWSIAVPAAFREAFVDEEDAEAYWHGYDDHRSISLTSYLIVDEFRGPVSGEELTRALAPPKGARMEEPPPGLLGWGTRGRASGQARASRMLQGMLATDGRALVVTITSDDLDWARRIWLSIRNHPVPLAEDGPSRSDPAARMQ